MPSGKSSQGGQEASGQEDTEDESPSSPEVQDKTTNSTSQGLASGDLKAEAANLDEARGRSSPKLKTGIFAGLMLLICLALIIASSYRYMPSWFPNDESISLSRVGENETAAPTASVSEDTSNEGY